MKLVIDDIEKAQIFSIIFQHLKHITEYVNLSLKDDKLYIQAMDSSKISVFEVHLLSSFFTNYDKEENEVIGIHVSILYKILHIRDKKQKLELRVEDDKLAIEFTSNDPTLLNKYFQINLIDIDEELFAIPAMQADVSLTMDSLQFGEIVNQLNIFDDTLNIDCKEEKVTLASESSDQGNMKVEISKENAKDYEVNNELSSSYMLKLLHYISLYNKISSEIKLEISNEQPLKITYMLDNQDSQLNFYLAPKISD